MLNFFKPIGAGTVKTPAEKRQTVPAAVHTQKRPKLSSGATVDLANGDKRSVNISVEPIELDAEAVPMLAHRKQAPQPESSQQSSRHDIPSVAPISSDQPVAAAGISTKVESMNSSLVAQIAQEGHLQQTDSSGSNPPTSHVRRFKGVPYAPDAGSIGFLTNMGFNRDQAVRALKVTQGNIERAANWLLSGM